MDLRAGDVFYHKSDPTNTWTTLRVTENLVYFVHDSSGTKGYDSIEEFEISFTRGALKLDKFTHRKNRLISA